MQFAQYARALFGRSFGNGDFLMLFSARLDESGTDGQSPIVVVAGAVAVAHAWNRLELAWKRLLNGAPYHWKEFLDHEGHFAGWSDFKRRRFVERQERIIERNTIFRASIGVESAIHAEIKGRMRGIKGFHPDSDYSLCLRVLMFHISEELSKLDPDHRLSILIEDGPWASGAAVAYQRVAAMTNRRKPARHAHRLAGFAMAPKGEYRSLEAADYIAGSELEWMAAGHRRRRETARLSTVLSRPQLEQWYEGMIREKEARRAYGRRKPTNASSSAK